MTPSKHSSTKPESVPRSTRGSARLITAKTQRYSFGNYASFANAEALRLPTSTSIRASAAHAKSDLHWTNFSPTVGKRRVDAVVVYRYDGFASGESSVSTVRKAWLCSRRPDRSRIEGVTIRSRDVACAEQPNIRRFEHFL